MSDENNRFVRSQGGHSANELHNHGGQDDAREDKTEREDLEEEIEELDEEDTRVEVKTGKKIDIFDDDVEVPVDPAEIEPEVDPEDPIEEKKIAEAKKEEEAKAEEAIEEAIEEDAEAEAEPEAEPINDWKKKEENQAYMQIDEVKEPKAKKSGTGWKIATFLFALLAIAGCGVAVYLSLFDGTTKFLGREVISRVEGASTPAPSTPATPNNTPISEMKTDRYIYLDGYNLALKVPTNITHLSYDYHQFNMGDPESSTFEGNYSELNILGSVVKDGDGQGAPEFIENKQPGKVSLGTLTIGRLNPEFAKSNNLGAPIMTTEDGRSVWYEGPQVNYSTRADDKALEQESVTAIKNWLTNKDNYIKL